MISNRTSRSSLRAIRQPSVPANPLPTTVRSRGYLRIVWISLIATGVVLTIAVFALRSASSATPPPAPVVVETPPPPVAPSRPAQSFFAASDGAATNDGSLEQPLDLASALSSTGPLGPGDTLWLREGVYRGSFASEVSGHPEAAIYVKVFPGEHVVLDGAGSLRATLEIAGSDIWFWGLEVTNSDPQRTFDTPSNGNTRRATGVVVAAPRVRLIDMSVHDAFTGVMLSDKADGAVLYGCLIYNNGIREPQGGIGHGVLQSTAGRTELIDVVTFNNVGRGINAASGGDAGMLTLDGLVSFNNGHAAIGEEVVFKLENLFVEGAGATVRLTNSHVYHAPATTGQNLRLDNRRGSPGALTMTGSFLVGGSSSLSIANWRDATVTDNLFYLRSTVNPNVDQTIARVQSPSVANRYSWNGNRYVDETTRGYPFLFNEATNAYGGANLSYSEWREVSQFDRESRYGHERPSGEQIFVRRDQYETGRGSIVAYNWDHKATVLVPLDDFGLNDGDRVDVLDVDNPFGSPVVTQVYAGEPIAVPMTPPSEPRGDSGLVVRPRSTKPEFAVFLVRKAPAPKRTTTTR